MSLSRYKQLILASDFWRSQDAVFSLVDPTATFSRAGSAWRYYPQDDAIKMAEMGTDVLRCSWIRGNNGLWIRGAHLEPGLDNDIKNSNDFTASTWACYGGDTVSASAVEAPDGGGCHVFNEGASSQWHFINYITSLSQVYGNKVVLWARVKAAGRGIFYLRRNWSGNQYLAWFDIVNGVTLSKDVEIEESWIIDRENGWYDCACMWIAEANSSGYPKFGSAVEEGVPSYQGESIDSFYIHHTQYEHTGCIGFPTSDIVTGGSIGTRAADSTWQVAAPLPDALQGWLAFKYWIPAHTPAAEIPILTLSDGGSAADRIRAAINTSGNLELQSAATGGDAGFCEGSSVADGNVHSCYLTWRPGELSLVLDGVCTSDLVVTIPDGLDQLELHPSGGIIGDIQMGKKYSRIPWRLAAAGSA